jgi:hypothetical protein
MLSAAVLSLLLLAQQTPSPSDEPVATQRSTPRIPAGPAVDPTNLPIPAGAPSDDFGLTAWCHGALRGHMELAKTVGEHEEELDAIGREYLQGYDKALAVSDEGTTAAGKQTAAAARKTGYDSWASARTSANKETQRYAYLGWQLPGRCEHAAKRISNNPNLFSAALTTPTMTSDGPQPMPSPATR